MNLLALIVGIASAVRMNKLGLIHVITGNGKGKTTSGMGGVLRAHGRGLKVRIIQLFKRDTGEKTPMETLGVSYAQFPPLHPYFKKYSEENLQSLKQELATFWNKHTNNLDQVDVLMVDEMGPALHWHVFEEKILLEFLEKKPKYLEVILTGRDFPKSVKAKADYVSEVTLVKHPYEKGILARKGIEF